MRSLLLSAFAITLLSACGQFVDPLDYEPGTLSPGGTDGVVRTDVKSLKHTLFADLIERFTQKSADGGFVVIDYDALAGDVDAQFQLQGYLAMLGSVDASGLESKSEKLAYFINAYNAGVIKGVLDMWNGDQGFKTVEAAGFFSEPRYTIGGLQLSLNHIEHGPGRADFVARAADFTNMTDAARTKLEGWATEIWGSENPDSRVHAAFNCGALSCPNLPGAAPFVFDAKTLDAQLDAFTTAWVDNVKKGAGPDGISMLFSWYKTDFERTHGSPKAFIEAFRSGGTSDVAFDKSLDYDWTLNSTKNMPSSGQ
ncbi:MAG: DUF547 domain-containing protein [Myxococcales bacterium]|nr:DUF547 domain-containing protein [Myxococcales bacterium]